MKRKFMGEKTLRKVIQIIADEMVRVGAERLGRKSRSLLYYKEDFGTLKDFLWDSRNIDYLLQALNSHVAIFGAAFEDHVIQLMYYPVFCPHLEENPDEFLPEERLIYLTEDQKNYILSVLDFGGAAVDDDEIALVDELRARRWYVTKGNAEILKLCKEADWEDDFPYVLMHEGNNKGDLLRFEDCISWEAFVAMMNIK